MTPSLLYNYAVFSPAADGLRRLCRRIYCQLPFRALLLGVAGCFDRGFLWRFRSSDSSIALTHWQHLDKRVAFGQEAAVVTVESRRTVSVQCQPVRFSGGGPGRGIFLLCTVLAVTLTVPAFAADRPSTRFVPSPGAFVNDREIRITGREAAAAKRAEIIRYIWGKAGMPLAKLPAGVERAAVRPDNLKNLERVDTLRIAMDAGVKGLAHLFLPKKYNNSRVVILHLGHTDGCTFNDNQPGEPDIGMRRTLSALLAEGFTVLGVYMPQVTPEDCRWEHDRLFRLNTSGSPLKFFVEPTLAGINYLQKTYPKLRDFSMTGLSGGGWTTTLYAAIDPRIRLSIPVAGSLPLYLCREGYGHDVEQRLDSFYAMAGYPDLYLLGSYGKGRRQVQVLNRHDDCCFGEGQHDRRLTGVPFEPAVREYENRVKNVLERLGSGSFRVFIDEKADGHRISPHALSTIILPELRQAGRKIPR